MGWQRYFSLFCLYVFMLPKWTWIISIMRYLLHQGLFGLVSPPSTIKKPPWHLSFQKEWIIPFTTLCQNPVLHLLFVLSILLQKLLFQSCSFQLDKWNMYFIHLFIFRANILVVPGTPDKYSQRFLSLKKIFKLVKSLLVMLFSFVPFLVQ